MSYLPYYIRGEWVRTALVLAGVKWADYVVDFKMWKDHKVHTPNGYLPCLEDRSAGRLGKEGLMD